MKILCRVRYLCRIKPYLVERKSVLNLIENLKTYPWTKSKVDADELQLHGRWFDLESRNLWATNPKTGDFLPADIH